MIHNYFCRPWLNDRRIQRASLAFGALIVICVSNAHAQLRYAGSDTVEPVVNAAQIAYARGHAGYKLQIQASGTGPGIRELCTARAGLVGASRPIKPDEAQNCVSAGVQYIEVPVALDAVVLVVAAKNTWLKELTLAEARTVFDPASAGKTISWSQIRPSFPDVPIRPAGVGIKHGTFSFFTEAMGLKGFIRSDFKDLPDHAGTGRYVAAEVGAIGFMPIGEAQSLDGQVRKLGLDLGAGVVLSGVEEVLSGKYDRFARTVYLYVNPALLAKGSAQDIEFSKLLINDTEKFVRFAGLIPLRGLQYQENIRRVAPGR